MPHYTFEEFMPVSRYGWEPTEGQVKAKAQKKIQELGFQDRLTITEVEFLEYDSSNYVHASGYWDVTVTGEQKALDDFANAIGDNDD